MPNDVKRNCLKEPQVHQMFICTGCLLNTESLKCKHRDKLPSKQCKRTHIQTDITHRYSRAKMANVRSGYEIRQLFPRWFTSLSRRGESHKLPFCGFLQDPLLSLRPSPFPAVPQLQLRPEPQPQSQLQARSFLQPQSEPPSFWAVLLACHRLGPGLARPETIGGHEAVCKAPAKPVC